MLLHIHSHPVTLYSPQGGHFQAGHNTTMTYQLTLNWTLNYTLPLNEADKQLEKISINSFAYHLHPVYLWCFHTQCETVSVENEIIRNI